MIIPDTLKEKDSIGFVAPSFGCNIEPYKSAFIHAQKKWQEKGFHLELGPNCYEGAGIGISNTPEKCGQEIMDFFMRDSLGAILSCGGGELMCEILDTIDFDTIKTQKPKWFMGYSDNTNLTFLLPTLCDIAAIYGPNAPAFGMEPWHSSIQDAYDLLTGRTDTVHSYDLWEKESIKTEENPLQPYHVTEPFRLHANREGETHIEGRLLGGCLDCLGNLVGTQYDKVRQFQARYKEDGIIWFLESCELNVMSIRRTLWQLSHAGWFEGAKGFLIGRPGCYGVEEFGLNHYQAFLGALSEYNVPVIMDLDIGHLPPMMPLVCGALAEVDVCGNTIGIKMNIHH